MIVVGMPRSRWYEHIIRKTSEGWNKESVRGPGKVGGLRLEETEKGMVRTGQDC